MLEGSVTLKSEASRLVTWSPLMSRLLSGAAMKFTGVEPVPVAETATGEAEMGSAAETV